MTKKVDKVDWKQEYFNLCKFTNSFQERLAKYEESLRVAVEALDQIRKGCPTNYPGCTCVRDTAIFTLAHLKAKGHSGEEK